MADVILCYAREDEAAAGRLAASVRHRGYRLWSEADLGAADGGDVTDRISGAKAAIVLWSAAAAASEWVRAEANFARGQRKLIQASLDEAPPPLPFRPSDAVSLAGWRGEEGHAGWRRIEAALAALCGPAPAQEHRVAPAVAPVAAPAAVERRRGGALFVAGITLALLAAVALATFLWMRDIAPAAADRGRAPTAATASPAAPAAPPPPASVAPEPGMDETVATPEPPAAEIGPPARPRPAGPPIIRENAENMRLFCERAGRGTPECRTFARRLREQRR